jgi:hypothetical protein
MPLVWFESTVLAGERPQTYALERAATGTGKTCKATESTDREININVTTRTARV